MKAKQETIKRLTDLMATIAMAYYKKGLFTPPEEDDGFGKYNRLWVHEFGEAGVSIDLYDLFDDGLPKCEHLTSKDQTHVAGMPARQEVYCISYDPDREPCAVTLLCKDENVDETDDSFDLELADAPEETLKSITAWIEGLMKNEAPEPPKGER